MQNGWKVILLLNSQYRVVVMRLNIGYFADGPWSHETFKKLIVDNEISIKFVCVRYDTQDETLKQYCIKYNINYIKDKNS